MPASSKEFLDIQATIECAFTLKRVHYIVRTYSQLCLKNVIDVLLSLLLILKTFHIFF